MSSARVFAARADSPLFPLQTPPFRAAFFLFGAQL
jgi:hypothetical protein